jgi:hypothetical protein
MYPLSEEEKAKARERRLDEISRQHEIYIKGQMDFVKWTVAISTGAMALSIDALDVLQSKYVPLVNFAIGLSFLFVSILCAGLFVNQWLDMIFLSNELRSLFYKYLLLPNGLRDLIMKGKTEREFLHEGYDQVEAKMAEIDALQSKSVFYFRIHMTAFVLGLCFLIGTLFFSAIWQIKPI